MEYAIALGGIIGLAGGAIAGCLLTLAIARFLGRRTQRPRIVAISTCAAFLVALPFAFFVSSVVGGTIGGGSGAFLSEHLGFESVGVPLGLAVGIGLVFSSGLAMAAAIGGAVGYCLAIALGGKLAG